MGVSRFDRVSCAKVQSLTASTPVRQTQTLVTALDVLLHAPSVLLLRQRTPLEAVLRVARLFLEASSSVWGNIEWLFAWRHRYRRIIMRWECHAANGWAPRSLTRRTLGSSRCRPIPTRRILRTRATCSTDTATASCFAPSLFRLAQCSWCGRVAEIVPDGVGHRPHSDR